MSSFFWIVTRCRALLCRVSGKTVAQAILGYLTVSKDDPGSMHRVIAVYE